MKSTNLSIFFIAILICCSYVGYGQDVNIYSGIDTENVLSYKVDEVINTQFGGSTTHYNVSNLLLISKVSLGPGNLRIITPIYKDGRATKKYYVETENLEQGRSKKRKPNVVYEIIIEDDQATKGNSYSNGSLDKNKVTLPPKRFIPIKKALYSKPPTNSVKSKEKVDNDTITRELQPKTGANQKQNSIPNRVKTTKIVTSKQLVRKQYISKTTDLIASNSRDVDHKSTSEKVVHADEYSQKISSEKLKKGNENKSKRSRRRKNRRSKKLNLSQESAALTKVYSYKIREQKASIIEDSVSDESLKNKLKETLGNKLQLSSKALKLHDSRVNKDKNERITSDSKNDNDAKSKKEARRALREKRRKESVNYRSLDNSSKRAKLTKETSNGSPKLLELKTQVSAINTVESVDIVTVYLSSLTPSTLFSLSTMTAKAVVKAEQPIARKTSITINVIEVYERVALKGYMSLDMFQKIADSHFFKEDMEKAAIWYEKLFAFTNKVEPVYYFRYGIALQKIGKSAKGDKMIEKFNELNK
ncbi:hypothetical protein [Flavobacterium sp.]|uniref:hypothetical protein n=1 Tax=Flavobacterium sp. TaxID=239 RepID=UPI00262977D7|nr:hypothetical protein [Flavobacterium sp.]MDG2433326.1 hypothetical protein [Flavobacterium sp.]